MLIKTWEDHESELCAGLNWDRFTNVEQAKVWSNLLVFYEGPLGDAMNKYLEC